MLLHHPTGAHDSSRHQERQRSRSRSRPSTQERHHVNGARSGSADSDLHLRSSASFSKWGLMDRRHDTLDGHARRDSRLEAPAVEVATLKAPTLKAPTQDILESSGLAIEATQSRRVLCVNEAPTTAVEAPTLKSQDAENTLSRVQQDCVVPSGPMKKGRARQMPQLQPCNRRLPLNVALADLDTTQPYHNFSIDNRNVHHRERVVLKREVAALPICPPSFCPPPPTASK